MTLYLIGLGLWNLEDVTIRGKNAIDSCQALFLETYTSKMGCTIEDMEKFFGKKITPSPRELVEQQAEQILEPAKDGNSALLVMGDPLSATTHLDLITRAEKEGIKVEVIHNASVITGVADTGLELYKYGKITSIPFPAKSFRPKTPFEVYQMNQEMKLHTLFLLDLKPLEDRYMSVNQALAYLIEISFENESENKAKIEKDTYCLGCARLGSPDQLIKYGTAEELIKTDFGKPPHCLIIPGKLHFMEEEAIKRFL